jgi:hypothetical protein
VKSHVHYEAAFQSLLRERDIPHVAVDEAKKATFRDAKLKSFDLIVYSRLRTNWLVDVKGRRWSASRRGSRPSWENWVTRPDLDGLGSWQELFGDGFRGLLVFGYWVDSEAEPPAEITYDFHGLRYVFAGVPVDDYRLHARVRSPRWDTVHMPARDFARFVRPLNDWL